MAARGEAVVVVVPEGDRERLQNQERFLNAAHALMLLGAIANTGTASTDPMQAFLSLLLWLLGVCVLSLVPAAGRFPPAALAAAAMTIAILKHLFTLWN